MVSFVKKYPGSTQELSKGTNNVISLGPKSYFKKTKTNATEKPDILSFASNFVQIPVNI